MHPENTGPAHAVSRNHSTMSRATAAGRPQRGSWVNRVLAGLAWLLIVIGAVLFAGGRWIIKTFGYITPDQMMMNLRGADGSSKEFLLSGIVQIGVIPVASVAVLFSAWLLGRRWIRSHHPTRAKFGALAASLAALAIAAPIVGAGSMSSAVQLEEYLATNDPSLDIGSYYVGPTLLGEQPPTQYNLVMIYLEATEEALGDEKVIGQNLLAPLDAVTRGWDRIPELEQYRNFGWTMAGFVGTQCGVPLRAPSSEPIDESENNDAGILNDWEQDTYMESAVCLGDVLENQGYTNAFVGAAALSFAGKGSFLSSHGYSDLQGGEEWVRRGDIASVPGWWGPSDGTVMTLAKNKVLELRQAEKPFNLTILTTDTHEPATKQDYCEITTEVEMESVVTCSMEQVADFVHFLQDEGFMDDTVVVLMGDHLRMAGPLDDKIRASEVDRTVFNRIHVPGNKKVAVTRTDQFAMYPTLLEALGMDVEDGRAGLGVSAYRREADGEALQSLPDEERRSMVASRSQDFYDRLWDIPSELQAAREAG